MSYFLFLAIFTLLVDKKKKKKRYKHQNTSTFLLISFSVGNHPYHSVSVTFVTVDDVKTTSLLCLGRGIKYWNHPSHSVSVTKRQLSVTWKPLLVKQTRPLEVRLP
jgi:hypothetical protein